MMELSIVIESVARKYRLGFTTKASIEMVDLLSDITTTSIPMLDATQKQAFNVLLAQMLGCQERRDWPGLADYLEYDLQAFLRTTRK